MDFDVFFSISQTPVAGVAPNEATMFSNFFEQVEAADAEARAHVLVPLPRAVVELRHLGVRQVLDLQLARHERRAQVEG